MKRLGVLAATLTICGMTMVSCSAKSTEVRRVCGTLDGPTADMALPDSSSIQAFDSYDVQQAFCQRLGYTTDGEQITLYLDGEPVATVTNTVADMGGFDDDAIWVGEQISYDCSGEKPRVSITPGVKFVVGLMLHYDDMPTFTASITMSDGIINLSDITIENQRIRCISQE